jgi:hypothetical protein
MSQLIYYIALAGAVLLLPLGGPVLTMLGWNFDTAGGSALFKIHPSTYIFAAGAGLALASGQRQFWTLLMRPWYLPFLLTALAIVARSVPIARAGGSGGEFSGALVSFVTPALMVLVFQMERTDLDRLGGLIRGFFVFNSLMALVERAIDHRFIPTFLDASGNEHRAAALLGHPLAAALLTGLVIINLVTAPKRETSLPMRGAEIGLHGLAMFAYGGRSSLLFLPFMLVAAMLFARNGGGTNRVTVAQRLAPFALIGVGVVVLLLPIPFVEATLSRFTNDNGSADTRLAAINILGSLSPSELMWGVDVFRRTTLMDFYHTPLGIELCWISLIVTYGLVVIAPLMIALPLFLVGIARRLDRSALYMAIYFLIVTAGSVGFATKSLIISDLILLMTTLARARVRGFSRVFGTAAGEGGRPRFRAPQPTGAT